MKKFCAILIIAMFLLAACEPRFLRASAPTHMKRVAPAISLLTPTETVVPTISLPMPSETLVPTISLPTPTETVAPTFTLTPTETVAPTLTLTATPEPTQTPLPSLRQLAEKHALVIGAAVGFAQIEKEQIFRDTVIHEFSVITSLGDMKMRATMPARDRYDFTAGDALVQFAEENGMKIRGHTLVWVGSEPDWLKNGTFTPDEAKAILKEYITTVVSHYKGRVYAWDVLNETVSGPPIWDKLIGPEYGKLAFEWAHEADPDALLFYNDFGIEKSGEKFDRVYTFVKELKEQGVPIHGVGMQMHIQAVPYMEEVAENMRKIADLGLQIHITEFDLPIDHSSATPLVDQARGYQEMLRVCLDAGNCTAFVMWGFTDKYSWLHYALKDPEADPLIFDRDYQPKPAYEALYMELKK